MNRLRKSSVIFKINIHMIFTVCLTYLQLLPSRFIAESQSVVISLATHTHQSIEGCGLWDCKLYYAYSAGFLAKLPVIPISRLNFMIILVILIPGSWSCSFPCGGTWQFRGGHVPYRGIALLPLHLSCSFRCGESLTAPRRSEVSLHY